MTMQPKSTSLCDRILICKAMALGDGTTKKKVSLQRKDRMFFARFTIGLPYQRHLRYLYLGFEIIHAHESLLVL